MHLPFTINDYRQQILSNYNRNPFKTQYVCKLIADNVEEAVLPATYILRYWHNRTWVIGSAHENTSLINYIAVQWAKEQLDFFPIVVEFPKYADEIQQAQSFASFLLDGDICRLSREYLEQEWCFGKSVIMVNNICNQKSAVVKQLLDFSCRYPKVRIIITQKVNDYSQLPTIYGFTIYVLQSPGNKIPHFTTRWPVFRQKDKTWEELRAMALKGDHHTRKEAIKKLAGAWSDHPGSLAFLKQRAVLDTSWSVCYVAIQEIAINWHKQSETFAFLKNRIIYEKECSVNFALIQAMSRFWPDKEFLLSLYNSDNEHIRYAAVHELAFICRGDCDIVSLLKKIYLKDDSYIVRCGVLRVLVIFWPEHAMVLDLLKRCLIYDNHVFLRWVAAEMMSKLEKSPAKALSLLKEKAEYCSDWYVREKALIELTDCWKYNPGVLELLEYAAVHDLDCRTRTTAIRQLPTYKKDKPQILSLIKNIARNHAKWYTRITAIEILAQWQDNEKVLPFLKEIASADLCWGTRYAAIKTWIEYSPDDPNILPLLKCMIQYKPHCYNFEREDLLPLLLSRLSDAEVLELLHNLILHDPNYEVRKASIAELLNRWPQRSKTFQLLRYCIVYDRKYEVRKVALHKLAQHWQNETTRKFMVAILQNGLCHKIRQEVFDIIVRNWQHHSQTFDLIKHLAECDEQENIRRSAIKALFYWQDQLVLMAFLQSLLVREKHISVCETILEILALNMKSDDFKAIVQHHFSTNKCNDIKRLTLQTLINQWPHELETVTAVKNYSTNKNFVTLQLKTFASHHCNDETIFKMLSKFLQGTSKMRIMAIDTLTFAWQNHPQTFTMLQSAALHDKNKIVRKAALENIAKLWIDNPHAISLFKKCALDDEDRGIRLLAIKALARNESNDVEVAEILQERATNDKSYAGELALLELIQCRKTDPGIVSFLKNCALNNNISKERCTIALHTLAKDWYKSINIFEFIKDCLNNGSPYSRNAALRKLVRSYHNHSETLPLLKKHLIYDEDEYVRSVAIKRFCRLWPDDSDLCTLIQQCIHCDKHQKMRYFAVREFARITANAPSTFSLLQQLAKEETDESVWQIAVNELCIGWRDHPDLLPFIQRLFIEHSNEYRRCNLSITLMNNWKQHVTTLPFLIRCAEKDKDEVVRTFVIKNLAKKWPNEHQVICLLEKIAQHDQDEDMRELASKQWQRLLRMKKLFAIGQTI